MEPWLQMIVSIVLAIFASTGFWSYLQNRNNETSSQSRMLVGLGHDRIVYLGMKYIERGSISHDEYENLETYLYEPYKALGGNGSADRIMEQVRKLPLSIKVEKPNNKKEGC